MEGKDLACWCKSKHKLVSCHGDNYVHILSPALRDRDWSKSITASLMADLRLCLNALHDYAFHQADAIQFLPRYYAWSETKLELEALLSLMKQEKWSIEDAHFVLACLIIDLELMLADQTIAGQEYRLEHARWIMNSVFWRWENRAHEPSPPDPAITKPKKMKN